jgi:hypothetical protein
MSFKVKIPSAADILIGLVIGVLLKGPISLVSNAVTGWTDNVIAEYFGLTSPSVVVVVNILWQWVLPFTAAALILVIYHYWNSRGGSAADYKAALDVALLQNPERVKSSPIYVKLKYNFEPKTGYKSPADQVRDGKVEFQKLYDQARKRDLESYLIAGHMAEWLRENARFCYASSEDFFDVLKFIETRMEDLHAIFRNERSPTKATAGPFGDVRSLSNIELKEATIRFATQMRTFEMNSKTESAKIESPTPANLTPEQSTYFYNDQVKRYQHLSARIRTEYANTFLQASIILRDELKGRLQRTGIFAVERARPAMPLIAFDGMLAGPHPISDAADYLEAMARRLQ